MRGKTLAVSAALAGVVAVGAGLGVADASFTKVSVLKPSKGLSFDVGTKRAVSHFETKDGACNLTLMVAETVETDGTAPHSAARLRVTVDPGRSARLDTAEGKSLEFGCWAAGQVMTVKPVEAADASPRS